jgi:hypothetical protein
MSDQEEQYLKYLPSNNKKRVWEGDEMELQHARDQMKRNQENTTDHCSSNVVAVNIQDFHNTQVGKGYQAKHVIRQRQVDQGDKQQMNIKDLSKPKVSSVFHSPSEQKVKHSKDANYNIYSLDALLKNKRLRDFRRELEKIYLEATDTKTRTSQPP